MTEPWPYDRFFVTNKDEEVFYLWRIEEDDNVTWWALAENAGKAIALTWELIENGDPDEVRKLICEAVSELDVKKATVYNEDGERVTMKDDCERDPRERHVACSEY